MPKPGSLAANMTDPDFLLDGFCDYELIEKLRDRKILPDCDWQQTIRELRAAIREGNRAEIDLLPERVEKVKI